jgi:crotonobetainyl-CoA:carnitine CoA-transferase CaiB-like acyl-CoA transferase
VAELAPADTCVTPVYTVPELTRDPHFAARDAFTDARHPERGRFRQVGPVLAGSPRSAGPCELPGSQQTDTGDLLGEAGLRPQEIEKLRAEGVVA